jgi:lysyl endopeptidase
VSAFFAAASFRLTIAVAGKGTVRSARSGITCRPRCSSTFASYVPVRLDATPAKGWKLRSWSGACKGSKATCSVPMRAVTKARATFVRA